LQSYYECFLQIEKENDSLKLKIEQMRDRLAQQQSKLESLSEKHEQQHERLNTNTTTTATTTTTTIVDVEVKQQRTHDNATDLNIISMQHMHTELNNVNKSVELFIEDKRTTIAANTNREELTTETGQSLIVDATAAASHNNDEQMQMSKRRIDELELEKEALNKKLNSIEASLARWIFRACDYKSDLSASNQRCATLEKELEELKEKLNSEQIAHSSRLDELQKESSLRLDELNNATQASVQKLEEKLRSEYESVIDKLNNEWKLKSDENINELAKIRLERDEKEHERARLSEKLKLIEERNFVHASTQTHQNEEPSKSCEHAQVKTNQIEVINGGGVVAQAVFNKSTAAASTTNALVITRKPQIGSMIAMQAAKLQQQLNFASVQAATSGDEKQQSHATAASAHHQQTQAHSELRLRIDQLLLEKNALKGKNDELKSDLAKLNKELNEIKNENQQQQKQQLIKSNSLINKHKPI
jgi:hypothetical protein